MGRSLNCLPRPMSWGLQLKEQQNSKVFFFGVCVGTAYNHSPATTLCRVVGASVEADSIWDLLFFKPKIRHSGCSRGTGVDNRRNCDKGTILERYIMDHNGGFLWHLMNFHIFCDCQKVFTPKWPGVTLRKSLPPRYWGKVDSCMPAFMVAGLFEAYGDMVV